MSGDRYAYRVLWEAAHGTLPRTLILHHLCGTKWCVRLSHLVPMTRAEHIAVHGWTGDWGQAAKTHCPAGHPYDAVNTYVYARSDGGVERHCRACRFEAKRRYRARHAKI
jgi:hypothetical protein